jgi:abortive infection alpha-like protein
VLIPLLQAAVDEDREELQTLWAALLENVMIDGGHRVRRSFFDVLRQLEPADAFVLDLIRRSQNRDVGNDRSAREGAMQFLRNEAADAGIPANGLEVSLDALGRLGCVQPRERSGPPPLSAFGLAMLDACTVR